MGGLGMNDEMLDHLDVVGVEMNVFVKVGDKESYFFE